MRQPIALSALLAALLSGTVLHAMTQDDLLQASLLSGWQMEGGHHMAGLSLALAPGWKTYWRSPGEAGIPPSFDWTGSTNVKSVLVHWPSPVVFHLNGMQTVGYKDGVILPLEVIPQDPAAPVTLQGRIDLGICKDICMPASIDVQAELKAPGMSDGAIQTALDARPETGEQAGLDRIACEVEPIADGLRVTATLHLPERGAEETVIFEPADGSIWVGESQSHREGGVLTSVAEMVASTGAPFALDRSSMTVTVLGHGRAVEIDGCPAP